MKYLKENYKNILVLILGITTIAFGSYLIITAKIGSDSITIFSQGLSKSFKIEYGYAYIISNIIFLTFMIIFNRKKIGVGTIFSTIFIGLIIELFLKLLPFTEPSSTFLKLTVSILGFVVVSFGLALYMYSNTGLGAFEAFVEFFSTKFKVKFGFIKITFDAILFGIGALLGGVFGISSILSVIIIGPLIDLFTLIIKKFNLLKKEETTEEILTDSESNNSLE